MSVESKWKLVISSNLAYDERHTGPIPPKSVLIFQVEFLNIYYSISPLLLASNVCAFLEQ
jgi:hypothetical protein